MVGFSKSGHILYIAMHVHNLGSFMVIIGENSLNEDSSYMHRRAVVLH